VEGIMAKQSSVFTQQTPAGEIQATSMDLLRAVTQLVERQRPSVDDLIAAVTSGWADEPATV
jgi:hypothetical protein